MSVARSSGHARLPLTAHSGEILAQDARIVLPVFRTRHRRHGVRSCAQEDANTIRVTGTQKGSLADGKLRKGDVIVGVGEDQFGRNPKRGIAKAIDEAESEADGGKMTLMLNGRM